MTRSDAPRNADQAELDKFGGLAATWWEPDGPSRTLHDINPCRLSFITTRCNLTHAAVLDVGCGGGLLTEALAAHAAAVTGIDAAPEVLEVAREHAATTGRRIHYACVTAEEFAVAKPGAFDCVVSMELLEHVPDPQSLIGALRDLVKPGGDVFLSTLNRTPRAYVEAVLAAEYVLRLLPAGTHDYRQFLRPSEIALLLRKAGLTVKAIVGMRYNPFTRRATLTTSPQVNYLVHARRE